MPNFTTSKGFVLHFFSIQSCCFVLWFNSGMQIAHSHQVGSGRESES